MISHVHQHNRDDWTVAPEGALWSSCMVGDVTPKEWNGWVGPHLLLLKDTRKGAFANRLLADGRTFLYELPPAKSKAQGATLQALHREVDADEKRVEVRLFSVECARNFYLGEFSIASVDKLEGRTYARLHRLAAQDEAVRASYGVATRPKRSRSESRHAAVLAALLPGWRVVHEPECVSFYDSELVVDGRMRPWGGDQYVVDYVAACGSRRVCFESKASDDGFDEAARLKCRALRDQSLTRVVAIVDHGSRLRWHDFGCPGASEEQAGMCLDELRERLGA